MEIQLGKNQKPELIHTKTDLHNLNWLYFFSLIFQNSIFNTKIPYAHTYNWPLTFFFYEIESKPLKTLYKPRFSA